MSQELLILTVTIAFFHTLFGPDHYVPFIALARAEKWSFAKTLRTIFLCGLGHTLSSIVLAIAGIVFGFALVQLEIIESLRGNLAAWMLIAFGLVYFVWGLRRDLRKKNEATGQTTPRLLLAIFILGPCEPLIPLLMMPAAKGSLGGIIGVASLFSIVTILTMTTLVLVLSFGVNLLPLRHLKRHAHALAGMAIFFCGIAVHFLGL